MYALTKYDQERMCLLLGEAYRFPVVALRFFNVYGTRQALSNPYTGVLAIFPSRLLNGRPPILFEDGLQQRDFVVGDIRHCFADIDRAREVLGYRPRVELELGLKELAERLATQEAHDRVEAANRELDRRGLQVGGRGEGARG